MSNLERIGEALSYPEILAQLAEEAAELAQAALKMRRAMDGMNPTPVSVLDAFSGMKEELADVLTCALALGFDDEEAKREIREISDAKTARWVKRLEEKR